MKRAKSSRASHALFQRVLRTQNRAHNPCLWINPTGSKIQDSTLQHERNPGIFSSLAKPRRGAETITPGARSNPGGVVENRIQAPQGRSKSELFRSSTARQHRHCYRSTTHNIHGRAQIRFADRERTVMPGRGKLPVTGSLLSESSRSGDGYKVAAPLAGL